MPSEPLDMLSQMAPAFLAPGMGCKEEAITLTDGVVSRDGARDGHYITAINTAVYVVIYDEIIIRSSHNAESVETQVVIMNNEGNCKYT